jgi:DNA-binding IclR family transcriptional regulator
MSPQPEADVKAKSDDAGLSGGVAAVDRALSILGAFRRGDPPLPLVEITRRTKLDKRTILRIMQTVMRRNYVQRLESGCYRIGPTPLILGALYQSGLKLGDILLPLMRQLAEQTGETVAIYVRNGDVRVCLLRLDTNRAVRSHIREGDVLPLERGSGGRVLLAFAGARGEPYETIRREYYYASSGERDIETAGISVPFFGTSEVLGTLTLAGPRSRIDKAFVAHGRSLLLRAAARATNSLGGDAEPIKAALESGSLRCPPHLRSCTRRLRRGSDP